MIQPYAFGRKLPRNDWEGDDPIANYKTCMDTAAGRAVAWATNGRIDKDGNTYRHAIHPHDPDGITLDQAADEIMAVAHLKLVVKRGAELPWVKSHLKTGGGLIIIGMYDTLPREYREQDAAHFTHALWVSHIGSTNKIRTWDALNRRAGYGRWIPAAAIYKFMYSIPGNAGDVGYVPLQRLNY